MLRFGQYLVKDGASLGTDPTASTITTELPALTSGPGACHKLTNARPATIGFIGGTGPEGHGLAVRFAMAGHDVVIGSRDDERAKSAAEEVRKIHTPCRRPGSFSSPSRTAA